MENKIPKVEDLTIKNNQPNVDDILIDDMYVVMEAKNFFKLEEHNYDYPPDRYVGKMWKVRCGNEFYLGWFNKYVKGKSSDIQYRTILILN